MESCETTDANITFVSAESQVLYRLVCDQRGGVGHVFMLYNFLQFHQGRYAHLSASLADEYEELRQTRSTFLLLDMMFRCIAMHCEFPETDPILSLQPLRLVQRKHAYVTPMLHKLLCTVRPRITTYHWDDCKSVMKHLFRQLFNCTLIWNRDRHQGLLPHEPFRILPDTHVWTRHLEFLCSIRHQGSHAFYTLHYMAHFPFSVLNSSPVGFTTSAVGDTTSAVGDTTSEVGDTTSSGGDMTSAVGDMTSAVGDTTSAVGDMTSEVGDTTSEVGDTTFVEVEHMNMFTTTETHVDSYDIFTTRNNSDELLQAEYDRLLDFLG